MTNFDPGITLLIFCLNPLGHETSSSTDSVLSPRPKHNLG